MTHEAQQVLEEAYERLHATGPEFQEWLSNHGPMAVEALARHGQAAVIQSWVDDYLKRLEDFPRPGDPITADTWREALGDPRRLGDWPVWFRRELAERDWTEVLADWWPRLLPGVVASATHGVIRVGHAVRTLREQGVSEPRLEELAQAFGYWAARWQPVAGVREPSGELSATAALAAVPRVPDQSAGINHRLGQLADVSDWPTSQAALHPLQAASDAPDYLREVVTAAVARYRTHGHGNGVMLVHSATAPNAVLRVLPSLPRDQWPSSAQIAWTAASAVLAAYAPAEAAPAGELPDAPTGPEAADEVFAAATANGDEHVIKFADTARDVYEWTGDPAALDAAMRCTELIPGTG